MMALGKGVGTRYPEQAPRAVERLGLRGEMRAGMRAEQHQLSGKVLMMHVISCHFCIMLGPHWTNVDVNQTGSTWQHNGELTKSLGGRTDRASRSTIG